MYQVYIEAHKCTLDERLKTFARLQYDRISLTFKLCQTSLWLKRVCEYPPENSLDCLDLNRFGGLRKLYVIIALLSVNTENCVH